ncbi:MAG: MerR family transcriptional regulator, partial [Bacillota bacterium]|nr:MerR family transcriptional regulator [Bacillota bacterium]
PQTLRVLERYGLVCPFRTENNIRLYSENDLILLRRICHLIRVERINVAGVRVILRMEGILSDEEVQGPGAQGSPARRIPVEVEDEEEVPGSSRGKQARRAGVDEEVRLYGEGRGHRPGND